MSAVAVMAMNAWQRYERARRAFEVAQRAVKNAQDEFDRARGDLTAAHLALDAEILQKPERV